MTVCVVDIDGTLADASHRMHLIQKDEPDWQTFSSPELVMQDAVHPGAKEALDQFRKLKTQICYLTGRNEKGRKVTEQWLRQGIGWVPLREPLFMRTHEYEDLAASEYKAKQFEKIKYFYEGEQFIFFEDDPFVAKMYREHGLVMQAPACWNILAYGASLNEPEPKWRY